MKRMLYFEEESINRSLTCPLCNKRLKQPVLLPCEEYVCLECIRIEDYDDDDDGRDKIKQFKCVLCDGNHLMPENGFPKSKLVDRWLEFKPKKVNRGKVIESFNDDLNKCMAEINEIKNSLATKVEQIRDYFDLKRYEIRTAAESKVDEINKREAELFDQLDLLEKEHMKNLVDSGVKQKRIEIYLKESEKFCQKWLDRIKWPETGEEEVANERAELNKFLLFVLDSKRDARDYIFNSMKINFAEYQQQSNELLLGKLEIESFKVDWFRLKNLSLTVGRCIDFDNHLLLGVNHFKGGIMFVYSVQNFHFNKRNNSEELDVKISFTKLDPSGNLVSESSKSFTFRSVDDLVDTHFYRSFNSVSNGTHALVSICFPGYNHQCISLIANKKFKRHDLEISTHTEFKTSIDAQQVYVMNAIKKMLEVYDLKMKLVKSIKIRDEYLFDANESIMINDNLLYACNPTRIAVFNLGKDESAAEIKSISSFHIISPISTHLLKDYYVMRLKDRLKFIEINSGKEFQRAYIDLDLNDPNLQIRALNENQLIFFYRKSIEIFTT